MGKNKLKRFAEMETFPNAIQPDFNKIMHEDFEWKGKWREEYFKNDNPIVLELGCGKGEYTVGLAKKFPNKNFIGIDIKGARLWRGAKTCIEEGISNAAFLRTRIEFIRSFFGENEIDEIWITFPDPQLKDRREKKRLTHPRFNDQYRLFLKPEGIIHLKTDSAELYAYTQEVIEENKYERIMHTDDLYGPFMNTIEDPDFQELLKIKTHYEGIFTEKGHIITYTRYRI